MVYKECSTAFWLLPDAFAAGENFWKMRGGGKGFSLPLTLLYIYYSFPLSW